MKKIILSIGLLLSVYLIQAQVGIGTASPATSSQLDVTSTTKGFLPPRMTTAQRDAISTPATGLQIYNTDNKAIETFTGTTGEWLTVGQGKGAIATNISIGVNALYANTTGFENSAFGIESLKNNTNGSVNTAFGAYSLNTNVNGARNTAFGRKALYTANGAYDNTALGYIALLSNSTGSHNVAVGSEALVANTTAEYNTAVGSFSLWTNTTGGDNTAIGYSSLIFNQTGYRNIAAGFGALYANTTASYNAAFGAQSLSANTTGERNTAIGAGAIDFNTTGSYNAVLGFLAGRYIGDATTYNTEINNAVLIGANAMPLADHGTNEIVIGYNAVGNGSNTVQLGNTAITNVKTSGTVTVGAVTYPKTDGTAGQVLTTNGSGTPSWTTPSSTGNHYLGEEYLGGLIFNLFTTSDGMQHGLLVSKTETTATWSGASLVGADRTEGGAYNTNLMPTGAGTASTWVATLGAGWYLPSVDELVLLWHNRYYVNKTARAISSTLLSSTAGYWSSTETSASNAFYLYFYNGATDANGKTTTFSVRALRTF